MLSALCMNAPLNIQWASMPVDFISTESISNLFWLIDIPLLIFCSNEGSIISAYLGIAIWLWDSFEAANNISVNDYLNILGLKYFS